MTSLSVGDVSKADSLACAPNEFPLVGGIFICNGFAAFVKIRLLASLITSNPRVCEELS